MPNFLSLFYRCSDRSGADVNKVIGRKAVPFILGSERMEMFNRFFNRKCEKYTKCSILCSIHMKPITTITLDKHHKLFLKRLSIAMSMEWIGEA